MLISHAHADHAGGARSIWRGLPVRQVISGEPQDLPDELRALPCASGKQWEWDGVRFTLWHWSGATDSNQNSCVLQIEANGERLLLTGDIDARAERVLLDSPLAVSSHWLQAPHHGSRSSSSEAFVRALKPQGVLISRGHGNSFGHPHPLVVERYQRLGVQIYDSAEHGAVRLLLGEFTAPQAMGHAARFWRTAPSVSPAP